MDSLDDILSGRSPEPATPPEASAIAPPPTEASAPPAATETGATATPPPAASDMDRPRDDAGRFAPKAKDAGAAAPTVPPTVEQEPPQAVPVRALMEERQKRQQAEQELARLRQQQQGQPQQSPQPPDFYQDPEGRLSYEQQRVQQQITATKIDISREMVRATHPDYEEVEGVFAEAAQANPQLVQAMLSAPNPALYAYEMGQKLLAYREIGDPLSYRDRLEADIRAKLEAEYAAKTPVVPPPAPPVLPTSLGSAPTAAPRSSAPAWGGPTPLADILASRRR